MNYGICSTDFLEYAFRTDSYRLEITFNATELELRLRHDAERARTERAIPPSRCEHVRKIAEPKPNPLLVIVNSRKAAKKA